MYAPIKETQRNGNRRDFYGKNFCLSVPYHKLDRLDKMDDLIRMEGWVSRSQLILALIDKRHKAVLNGGV